MERLRARVRLPEVLAALLLLSVTDVVVEAQDCTGVTAPSQHQDVTAMAVSFSCVNVTWTAPSDAGGSMAVITRYIITWNGIEGSSVTVGAGSTTYQVTGLTPDATYSFTVSAENDCNMTSQGASATATTEGLPAVTNVMARPVSSSAIRVSWSYNTPTCGSVDGFVLTYRRSSGAQTMVSVSDGTKRLLNIAGLDGMQGTYTITMTAVYQSVASDASTAVVVDFNVPNGPENVVVMPVSRSELSVSWTAANQHPNAPPVMYYTVSWREEGGGDSHNTTGADNTMYQITGLAQYTVNVTAHNSVGESEAGSGTTLSVPHAVSAPDSAGLLPAVVALSVALFAVLLLLAAAVFTAILFYTRIQKLTAILKDAKGPHSHYDEVKMGSYNEDVIENSHSSFKFKAEAQYEEYGVGVTSNDVAMEENPAYTSVDLLH